MSNQPINEKWKIDFRKEFPSFLTDNHNGKIVPIYNGWWVFVQGYKRRNLPQDIEDFIENLLEQERKRLAKRIIKDDVTCPKAYGFEGRDTFHACEKCVVCELRSIINK